MLAYPRVYRRERREELEVTLCALDAERGGPSGWEALALARGGIGTHVSMLRASAGGVRLSVAGALLMLVAGVLPGRMWAIEGVGLNDVPVISGPPLALRVLLLGVGIVALRSALARGLGPAVVASLSGALVAAMLVVARLHQGVLVGSSPADYVLPVLAGMAVVAASLVALNRLTEYAAHIVVGASGLLAAVAALLSTLSAGSQGLPSLGALGPAALLALLAAIAWTLTLVAAPSPRSSVMSRGGPEHVDR